MNLIFSQEIDRNSSGTNFCETNTIDGKEVSSAAIVSRSVDWDNISGWVELFKNSPFTET
jgi:hypothetical protein